MSALEDLKQTKRAKMAELIKPLNNLIESENLSLMQQLLLTVDKRLVVGETEYTLKPKMKCLTTEERVCRFAEILEAPDSKYDKLAGLRAVLVEKKPVSGYQLTSKRVSN